MEITCYRDAACAQENLTLPAATYNLAVTQLQRSPGGCLFVPLRALQYLAIIDHEEFVFIDGVRKCWVDIAWRNFHPSRRLALDEPVEYEAVYYRPDAAPARRTAARLARARGQGISTRTGTRHQISRAHPDLTEVAHACRAPFSTRRRRVRGVHPHHIHRITDFPYLHKIVAACTADVTATHLASDFPASSASPRDPSTSIRPR